MTAINRYVNENLMNRLFVLSHGGQKSGKAFTQALKGGGKGESHVAQNISAGARLYQKSLAGINFVGSLLNYASSDLDTLGALTNAMIPIVENAAKTSVGTQQRSNLQTEFNRLARKFLDVKREADLNGDSYLTAARLETSLIAIGLDPQRVDSLEKIFDSMSTVGTVRDLASPKVKSEEPLPSHLQNMGAHFNADLFSRSRPITSVKDAEMVLRDLHALQQQIATNSEQLDNIRQNLLEHAELVRSTAIVFRELQSEALVSLDSAEKLAAEVGRRILRESHGGIKHVKDLEPMAVAALTLDQDTLLGY